MAASFIRISEWFDVGVAKKAKYMLVITDTFDHEDYPVYVYTDKECLDKYGNPGEMQRVMEVYDLGLDKDVQMNETRAMHLPLRPAPDYNA